MLEHYALLDIPVDGLDLQAILRQEQRHQNAVAILLIQEEQREIMLIVKISLQQYVLLYQEKK